ncbi:venom peptide isomerase heavy chain-like [Ostrinia nubilalis]|uniref:venom peptide isomerase heavy chain-like n=1 Tax=Ostrinia furnacalis TaxID=93504 RepID=UPI00103B6AEB|nr:venom peptide isomerase heavy chain-like [Ostrinia furnacalis]
MMKSFSLFLRFLVVIILIYEFVDISAAENVKKSVDDSRDDNGENDESKDESLDIPVENETNNMTCTRRQNSQMHEITTAKHKQFPFIAAVMSHQNEYLCSGSVVSNGLILTTAQCTQQPISYVLLNTTKDKKDDSVAMLHVTKTEKFPTFTGGESLKDVGLIYTEKHNSTVASKIRLSNYTSSRSIIDLEGIGFGLNADVGQVRELQYVGLEHRSPYDPSDILKAYFDCIETKVLTCYKDTGGPVIFDNELIGIVIKGQDECTKEMSSTYAINKRMADILPTYTFKAWLDEKIKKNEEQEQTVLATYPTKPVLREKPHKMTSSGVDRVAAHFLPLIITTMFFMLLCFV